MKKLKNTRNSAFTLFIGVFSLFVLMGLFSFSYFAAPGLFSTPYESHVVHAEPDMGNGTMATSTATTTQKTPSVVAELPIHIPTPYAVKSIYMSQCVVGTPSFREDLVEIAESTEINSIIIDIKDYTGKIAFPTNNPKLQESVSDQCGAYDMKDFVRSLNEKGIYVIGRITVFQDPYYTKTYPHLAVKKASATSTLWADYKGLNFIDAGAREFHDYIVELAKESFKLGFDELNFDYIRFPSDGPMQDVYYPFSQEKVETNQATGRAEVVESFFKYLHDELQAFTTPMLVDGSVEDVTPITSADLFGMTTTNTDDLTIGQQLEKALPYFDYVAPMVYPSHYPSGFNGWENPNDHVYGVISYSMGTAVERALASTTYVRSIGSERIGTSTPALYTKKVYDKDKLRPWIQDFDYGGDYDVPEVRAQIQATYDVGLDSWMLWAPSNRYTINALNPKEAVANATTSTSTEVGL